ncbi:hypothetical protein CSC2_43380 [Clostridium zeae]|uniref:TnsE C-terminal domain-containing protein n=1 Tax=Clostridium zeae TaxID=2759022 RepID=A0ABQ1EG52_9CLOT|nr:hypothetical protein [Clostridium zeae]GFZ33812.1 hypothetical protein CSC2_43380 [Clostridium zeae]
MGRETITIKNWPFNKGEKVKLTWIGEPFTKDNKYMFYAYFRGDKCSRRVLLNWASLHFLSVDKYYTDGRLNSGEMVETAEILDINLSGITPQYIEKPWKVRGIGFEDDYKSKTFNFKKNGRLYTIPLIEIIRAVIAPDRFTLNRAVEMDTLENYFIYEFDKNELDIHFTDLYEKKLLTSEKLNHLAWLITNPNIFKMFNSIGLNMWQSKELKFDFLFENFNIKARVLKKDNYIRILQILSLRKKRINTKEINIFHPSLEETQASDILKKKREFINTRNSDKEIDTGADGATKASDLIDDFLITHEYENIPTINKKKIGLKINRKMSDENTKEYLIEADKLRATADVGGESVIRGLEFTNLQKVEEKGELQEFIEMLRLLQKRKKIRSVEIIVDYLPEGSKFSRLKDGVTRRKYAKCIK